MKTLKNKQTTITITDHNRKVIPNASYFDMLSMMINNPPVNNMGIPLGFSLSEMRLRSKILKKIENCKNGKIELEDTEFDKLAECHDAFTWQKIQDECMELGDYMEEVKQQKEEK